VQAKKRKKNGSSAGDKDADPLDAEEHPSPAKKRRRAAEKRTDAAPNAAGGSAAEPMEGGTHLPQCQLSTCVYVCGSKLLITPLLLLAVQHEQPSSATDQHATCSCGAAAGCSCQQPSSSAEATDEEEVLAAYASRLILTKMQKAKIKRQDISWIVIGVPDTVPPA
jgi:hypothetical protein